MDRELRDEIKELLAANGFDDRLHNRLKREGLDSRTAKLLIVLPERLSTPLDEVPPKRPLQESFACRFILGCNPSPALRDYITDRLRVLQKIDPGVSTEPISPREAQTLIHAVIAFSPEGNRSHYLRYIAQQNSRQERS
jgi:hypothetical protein